MTISFVVQDINYNEMMDFIKLGEDLSKVGRNSRVSVMFNQLRNWGHITVEEFKARQVFDKDHPEYPRFLKILKEVDKIHKITHLHDEWPKVNHNFNVEVVS